MSPISLFVSCPRGVETLLVAEISALGADAPEARTGGVACVASLDAAYRICLWSRIASRVLMPLHRFAIPDADALYAEAATVDWPGLFDADRSFAIEVAGRSPTLTHTHYAGLKVKDAIVDGFRAAGFDRPNVDTDHPDIRIHLHLDRDQATLSLDLAGESLHRRGYRRSGTEAPMKENLAAAILMHAGWPALAAEGAALLDPMCGSGTLLIEGAMIAADIAPGLMRRGWGFEAWRGHQPERWKAVADEARQRRTAGLAVVRNHIRGGDLDPQAVNAARDNIHRAGLSDWVQVECGDALQMRPEPGTHGLWVSNPPYGERLGAEAELIKLYSLLGVHLKQQFGGWRAAVFTARGDLGPRLGLSAHAIHTLYNGAIACKLLCFEIRAQSASAAAAAPVGGGEDFANRLRKNARHLAKWARRNGVTNYRVYDADLPDYALVVDLYATPEMHAHVQEYAAPKTVEPAKAEQRLRAALARLQDVLELPAAQIHYKLRRAQKGTTQYRKQNETERFYTVVEHGCRLQVNFDDYLDTGLFLDHRPMRLRIQQEARGKRMLNLFCYTGAASVHAAVGGAAQTVSVDLSNTYLDWAKQNFALNDLRAWDYTHAPEPGASLAHHALVRADCLVWLRQQAAAPNRQRFDLIFLDPPTFSNSKRMDETLDIQRDHVELIQLCAALLAPGGCLYFSTNRRGFKLDTDALSGCACQDITAQTVDEDFRRPRPPHHCWRITATD
ncbi:bifunctional 23S rRNA (guanine(2069)-N(7))-methyltransferase RlmK/23S rRNA (guanine(2445)-N(2))-methyltransferase RlmL [Sinimarinibacterium sp. CAU 1509]|uniref:bifunctional 23S rRNA (guanine(2069)-N(7))-methyltransferase RlmK/23S rRNA (guanine(2445)-N(2))-methyltransferase RlmL n=1 Tax=Sinimarinibacterium sp. CAU 1509 TaxID=2562283 RepID=UPI0010AD6D02|nr:bifunctional 23S rRNA (guanine(2069)-N(7))-methyltransferase RlmK/23S rRNA (guanine(2445)-N(2))-methyltransferase RlmL [Sinimarinibacterium sp. CAU 1509]TJY62885.1 bifunctional 23S rRNA (guanine(2069)-N(7))-methyltransferase RlmK/23S rRNA (guanine(2445)-N(2))-methyltransferase RlmL [Sinimarinibacterium sp. CAU 1509]